MACAGSDCADIEDGFASRLEDALGLRNVFGSDHDNHTDTAIKRALEFAIGDVALLIDHLYISLIPIPDCP